MLARLRHRALLRGRFRKHQLVVVHAEGVALRGVRPSLVTHLNHTILMQAMLVNSVSKSILSMLLTSSGASGVVGWLVVRPRTTRASQWPRGPHSSCGQKEMIVAVVAMLGIMALCFDCCPEMRRGQREGRNPPCIIELSVKYSLGGDSGRATNG